MKFCKDCKFYSGELDYGMIECFHPKSHHETCLITGAKSYYGPSRMRGWTCGKDAVLFERKISILERIRNWWNS